MGLLSDYQALGADQQQLAALQGNVTTATAALDAAEAAVQAEGTTITAATQQVLADLQAAPYNGYALVPGADATTFTLLSVAPTTPPSLSAQTVTVAS